MDTGSTKGRKVLVTGGAGFIGSHLVRRLVGEGADVTVLVKYNSVIDNVRLVSVWDDIRILEVDLRNVDSLRQFSGKRFDAIYHLAAYNHVGDSFQHVNEALLTNTVGTANLLECGLDYGRFVYMSTSECYGLQYEVPFKESATAFPISPYAVGKFGGELYARFKRHQTGQPIVCIRPFNTFGPYQSEKAVIPELIMRCLRGLPVVTTEGRQTREFNYVDNQVDGILAAAACEPPFEGIINIGSSHEIAICDLVRTIHTLCGTDAELRIGGLPNRPTEIWRMSSDNTLAKDVLGWTPKIDFEAGLARTVEWYRAYLAVYADRSGALHRL